MTSNQNLTNVWAEITDISETGVSKFIQNASTNNMQIALIYVGEIPPVGNEPSARIYPYGDSMLLAPSRTTQKVWGKSANNLSVLITVV